MSQETKLTATVAVREILKQSYLDWLNNYGSIETYAEHYGLYIDEARRLISLSRCHNGRDYPKGYRALQPR